MNISK